MLMMKMRRLITMRMTTMRFRAMRMRLRTMRMTTMRLRKMRTVATLEGKYDDIVLIMISTMKQRGGKKDCDKKRINRKILITTGR